MSLIQEALKRQQQEVNGAIPPKATVDTAPSAVAPPSAPPAPQTEPAISATPTPPNQSSSPSGSPVPSVEVQPTADTKDKKISSKKKSKKNTKEKTTGFSPEIPVMIILVTLFLASVAGIITYGIHYFGAKNSSQDPESVPKEEVCTTNSAETVIVAEIDASDTSPAKNTPLKPDVAVHNQVDDSQKTSQDKPEEEQTGEATDQITKNDSSEITTENSKDSVPPIEAVESVALPEQSPIHAPTPKPEPKPPVVWPAVKLEGIVGGGRGGAVMINNSVLGINEKIDGVLVVSIESKGVWLEYEKQRRFLKVGKTLQ